MSKKDTMDMRDTAEATDMPDTIDTMDIFDLMDLLETMDKADALALLRKMDTTDVLVMLDTMEVPDALDTLDIIYSGKEAESAQIEYILNKANDANADEILEMMYALNEMEYPDTMVIALEIKEDLERLYEKKKAEAWEPIQEALNMLGQTIYNARKAAKMSRAELGRLVGLHESTVKRYEDGNIKSPNMEKVAAFAEVLHLDYQELADWWIPQDHQRMNDSELKQFRLLDTLYSNNPDLTQACVVEINDKNMAVWQELMEQFDHLNEAGQEKVLSYLSDLTTHPHYQRDTERVNRFFAIDRISGDIE